MSLKPLDNRKGESPSRAESLADRLKEMDRFFQGTDAVHQTMYRLVSQLSQANIPYAIVGGMAVNAHGLKQTTSDVDILLTAQGLEQFRQAFVGSAYDPVRNKRRRYVDRLNGIQVDVIVTGHYAGRDGPGPVAFPDSQESSEGIDSIRVLTLPNLIQLKLAARRYRHLGDVAHLIRIHDLDESFLEKLHPSVHADYLKCLDEKRREEEFEALQI